jgi:DNA polymerase-1
MSQQEDGHPAWRDVVLVVDFSYLCRLFYEMMARPRLDNPDYDKSVRPTPFAIDGAMNAIMEWAEKKPSMFFVALDSGTSVREDIYPEYKGFREKPPEFWGCYELCLRELKDNFSDEIHVVAAEGWEADDVCATLARDAVGTGHKCLIVANDKDLFQILQDGKIHMLKRANDSLGRPSWGVFTESQAKAKWGGLATSQQMIDFQILTGDKTDTIPGVDGVGDVKAVGLLKKYGSIEVMKTQDIPGKMGENLKEFWPMEPVVRQLVTLRTDVDVKIVPLFDALATAGRFQGMAKYAG